MANEIESRRTIFDFRFIAGLMAALLMVLLGNLGTIRMVYQGFEEMAAPGGNIANASIPQRMFGRRKDWEKL